MLSHVNRCIDIIRAFHAQILSECSALYGCVFLFIFADVHNAEFVLTGVLTQTLDYESYPFIC